MTQRKSQRRLRFADTERDQIQNGASGAQHLKLHFGRRCSSKRNHLSQFKERIWVQFFYFLEIMEKLKAILLINPYHIPTPYLYVGTDFFCLEANVCCACYRDYRLLSTYNRTSGNAYDAGILNISSQPVTFCTENRRNLLWEVLAPGVLINRFTNPPLLNRNIFWHFSLSYKLFLIN